MVAACTAVHKEAVRRYRHRSRQGVAVTALGLRVEFQRGVNRGGAKNAELSDQLYQIRETEVMRK